MIYKCQEKFYPLQIFGMVQLRMPKGNTFQAGSMATNTHNSLSKQQLRRKRQLATYRKVLPCSEPCQIFFKTTIYLPLRPSQLLITGANLTTTPEKTTLTIHISLIRMFKPGPEVSLNGSPTVSPMTAALWAGEPLPP